MKTTGSSLICRVGITVIISLIAAGCSYEMDTILHEKDILYVNGQHSMDYIVHTMETEVPVDVIFVIDDSGSMAEELVKVKNNINLMSTFMNNQNVDYHFIMLSDKGTDQYQIQVPEPLAGPGGSDTARFKHISQYIFSYDSLTQIVKRFDSYKDFLRDGSILNIVVVTDDDAGRKDASHKWDKFKQAMTDLGRPNFVMHGIVGMKPEDVAVKKIDAVGTEYLNGIDETGGIKCDITSDESWDAILLKICNGIINVTNNVFYLSMKPIPDTIKVYIGGVEQAGNWTYDEAKNAVVINEWSGLKVGDSVSIDYRDTGTLLPITH